MAVSATESSKGKKNANTGVKSVPNPKPEKKVRSDAPNATRGMMRNSMGPLIESLIEILSYVKKLSQH